MQIVNIGTKILFIGKDFGSGSRTPIAITLLVKNPEAKNKLAKIYYHDIGDYLSREQKSEIIKEFKSFANPQMPLEVNVPNVHGDWISVRNDVFSTFIPLDQKKSLI